MAKQLNVNLSFTADTAQAKKQIQDLQAALQNVAKLPGTMQGNFGETSIKKASEAALELQRHLNTAVNTNTGKLDLSRFSNSLKIANKDADELLNSLLKGGEQGQQAFLKLSSAIASAEAPTVRINRGLSEMLTTLKNTAKWQISSSLLHGFMGSIQSAYGYAQDLNESLNNIRIVTGQTTDQMAKFAEQANKAAKELNTTTTAYTDAALIFYQQGLGDSEVKERTDAVIKMANVTGDTATDVSSYMTAIWNNYAKGAENLEHFGDVITALGASTASSSSEIAQGLEKFASIGDTIGLSYDYATSILAALVANTRQSADTIGTSLRTIFARLQGLSLGETLEDGVNLNKYSKALQTIGVAVLDQNGALKEANEILDDTAAKWDTLSKAQQTALAQTIAGTRQYAQFVAMMESWDDVQTNLTTAATADGTLDKQAEIYAESWEAARDRVKASTEELYNDLLNDDFFITITKGFAGLIDAIDGLVKVLGGANGVLSMFGSLLLNKYAKEVPDMLRNWQQNIKQFSGTAPKEMMQMQSKLDETFNKIRNNKNLDNSFKIEAEGIQQVNKMNIALTESAGKLSKAQQEAYKQRIANVKVMYQEIEALEKIKQKQTEQGKLVKQKAAEAVAQKMTSYTDQYQKLGDKQALAIRERDIIGKRIGTSQEQDGDVQRFSTLEKTIQSCDDKMLALDEEIRAFNASLKEVGVSSSKLNSALDFSNPKVQIEEIAKVVSQAVAKEIDDFTRLQEELERYSLVRRSIQSKNDEGKTRTQVWKDELDAIKEDEQGIQRVKEEISSFINILKNLKTKDGKNLFDLKDFDKLEKELEEAGGDVEKLKKALDSLHNLPNDSETFKEGTKNVNQKVAQKGKQLKGQIGETDYAKVKDYAKDLAAVELNEDMDLINAEQQSKKKPFKTTDWDKKVQAYSQAASAVMMLNSAFQSVTNTMDTFSKAIKGEASAVEVITATLGSLTSVTMALNSANTAATALKEVGIALDLKSVATQSLKVIGIGTETTARVGLITVEKIQAALEKALTFQTLGFIAVIGALALALWGVIKVIKLVSDAINASAIAEEQAAEKAQRAADAYERVRTSIEKTKTALDELTSSSNLDNLIHGTEEWYKQVQKVNSEITSLLEKYPELNQMGFITNNDGLLGISEKGYNYIIEKENDRLSAVSNINSRAQQKKANVKADNKASQLDTSMFDNVPYSDTDKKNSLVDKDLGRIAAQYYQQAGDVMFIADSENSDEKLSGAEAIANELYDSSSRTESEWADVVQAVQSYLGKNEEGIKAIAANYENRALINDTIVNSILNNLGSNRSAGEAQELVGKEYEDYFDTSKDENIESFGNWNDHVNYSKNSPEWEKIQSFMDLQGDDVKYVAQRWGKLVLEIDGTEVKFDKEDVFDALAEEAANANFKNDLSQAVVNNLQNSLNSALSDKGITINLDDLSIDTIYTLDNLLSGFEKTFIQDALKNNSELNDNVINEAKGKASKIFLTFYKAVDSSIEGLDNYVKENLNYLNFSDSDTLNKINLQASRLGDKGAESLKQFTQAIKEMNEAAKMDQMSSFFSNAAEAMGLTDEDAKAMQEHAKHLMEISKESEIVSEELASSADSAADLAVEIARLNKGIESLADGIEDWSSILKKSTKESREYSDALSGIRDSMTDILDVNSDLISDNFIEEHLPDIEKAAKGDADAIDALRASMDEEIIANITLDQTDEFISNINSLDEEVKKAIPDIEIQAGAILYDEDFLAAANNLVKESEMSADKANAYFAGIGYEPLYSTEEIDNSAQMPNAETTVKIKSTDWDSAHVDMGILGEHDIQLPTITYTTESSSQDPTPADGSMKLTAFSGDETPPEIKGLRKKASGSLNNYSSSNKGGKSLGSSKSKGGSGGSNKKKKVDPNKDKADPYYNVNRAIKRTTNAIEKLEEAQSHAHGKELIKSLQKENELIEKQARNYEWEAKIINQELNKYRKENDGNNFIKFGLKFDSKTGEIVNYKTAFKKEHDKLAAAEKAFNASNQDESDEKAYEKAKERFEQFKQLVSDYDETLEKQRNNEKTKREQIYQQIANNYKIWETKIEVKLDLTEAKKEWNNFWKKTGENFKSVYKDIGRELKYTLNEALLQEDVFETYLKSVQDIQNDIDNNRFGTGSEYHYASKSEAEKALKEYEEKLRDSAEGLFDLYEGAWDSYLDGIDQVVDKWEKVLDKFDKINDRLDHQAKVTELLYGKDNSYSKKLSNDIYVATQKAYLAKMDEINRENTVMIQERARLQNMSNPDEKDSENIDKLTSAIEENEALMQSTIEDYITNIGDRYSNAIEMAFNEFAESITGGNGYDTVSQRWEDAQYAAEGYYDSVERIYQLQSMQNKWQSAIDSTSVLKSQQKLKDLMNDQLKALENKTKLSEYDITLAEKQLAIAQAQIALEEAQNNKNTMKLVRNEQGNWAYQYVADEDELDDKKQALLDANNDWYEFTKESQITLTGTILEEVQKAQEKISELMLKKANTELNLEELEKINNEIAYLENYYFGENGVVIKNLTRFSSYTENLNAATMNTLRGMYEANTDDYETMTEEQKSLLTELEKHGYNSYDLLLDAVAGNGGAYDQMRDKCEEVNEESLYSWSNLASTIIGQWATNPDSIRNTLANTLAVCTEYENQYRQAVQEGEEHSKQSYSNIDEQVRYILSDLNDVKTAQDALTTESELQLLKDLREQVQQLANAWQNATDNLSKYNNTPVETKTSGGTGGGSQDLSGNKDSNGNKDNGNSSNDNKSKGFKTQDAASRTGIDRHADDNKNIYTYQTPDGYWHYTTNKKTAQEERKKTEEELKKNITGAETGGYTGEWSDGSGKLAFLHSKELVLNKEDTANMLEAVSMVRSISNIGSSITAGVSNMIRNLLGISIPKVSDINMGTSAVGDNNEFNITAEFPNAESVEDIREAILSLPTLASQYLSQNKL